MSKHYGCASLLVHAPSGRPANAVYSAKEIVSNHEQTIRFLASQKVPMPLSGRAD